LSIEHSSPFPRTLLLTWNPPTLRFAGGEAVRKVLSVLPSDRVRWACLSDCACELGGDLPEYAAFGPRPWHWRLEGSLAGCLLRYEWAARQRARRIAEWVKHFKPEVVWTVPELDAIEVAARLCRRVGVPLHLTLHDAHECARFGGVPGAYLSRYLARAKRLIGMANSFDAVSRELLDHVGVHHGNVSRDNSLVLRPSVRHADLPAGGSRSMPGNEMKRIGVCGTLRISPEQWGRFLTAVGQATAKVEVLVVTDDDSFHSTVTPPANVRITRQSYFQSERALLEFFRSAGLSACYLGLWHEGGRRLFAATSLSSKLCAYAATAVPVIVDAPEESVAWRLVADYNAGVRIAPDGVTGETLGSLLRDGDRWQTMATGAGRLCREEFDLDRNVARFAQLLRKTADGYVGN